MMKTTEIVPQAYARLGVEKDAWENQWVRTKIIYHLLCRSFGQCVAISQIVHLDILDKIAVLGIDFTATARFVGGRFHRARFRRLEVLTSVVVVSCGIWDLPNELVGHPHAGCLSSRGSVH